MGPDPADHRLRGAELAAGQVDLELRLHGGIGGEHVDGSADRGASIERRVRSPHDLDTGGVVDRQRHDARLVARVRLRDAVDEQQGVRELVADARHAAKEHRLEDAKLGGDQGARRVFYGFSEPLVAATLHRFPVDDRRRCGHIADTERRLGGGHLHRFKDVGRRVRARW